MGKDHQNKLFQNSKLTKGLKQFMGTLIQKKEKKKEEEKKKQNSGFLVRTVKL